MEKQNLSELIAQVKVAMEHLGYSKKTILVHEHLFDELTEFANSSSESTFTEALGTRFLQETHEYPSGKSLRELPRAVRYAAGAIRKLGEYQAYGCFYRKPIRTSMQAWSLDDFALIDSFVKSMTTADTVEKTKSTNLFRIRKFYDFLTCKGIESICDVTARNISEYALSMQGDSRRYAQDKLSTLRQYLHYLYKKDYIAVDLSFAVPKIVAPRNKSIPAIWSEEELHTLYASIDRGSPAGKRDYAILVLTGGLGLRASDIGSLKLENLNWARKEIEVSQHKTGVINVCPMTDEVGWALIDYIRYSRPKSDLPYVFLTCCAPYTHFGSTTAICILKRQMQRCGLHDDSGVTRGMHSLRHTLARSLLEKNVPLELIADIMGHTEVKSSSPYLKVDINGLRECALSLKEVQNYA